jgi:putative serine protease PepD
VLYAQANPGVVDITGQTTTSVPGPFGLSQKAAATQSGTGLVLDKSGHVLTAGHVVAGTRNITVTFQGGATRTAKVLGSDTSADVAVLSVQPSGLALHPLSLGTLSGHRVGDPVAVIGDPFDVQRSLSTGVLSGLDRTIQAPNGYSIAHAIQTDAAMNPGNSGGPILDASGRVIGIADQIATGGSSDTSTGVGFAVPIDSIKSELAQLESGKVPAHANLGVGAADATSGGALVQSVTAGGPAARAGVHVGDVIVGLGPEKIAGVNALVAATMTTRPGAQTTLIVMRGGKRLTLHVTPGREPTQATTGG